MNYGVIILRAQPFHVGHISVIRQMVDECDKVLIIIGSKNKSGTIRNPFDYRIRKRMVNEALCDARIDLGKVKIAGLPDWSMEDAYKLVHEWGNYLYYNVVSQIEQKEFAIYYNDDVATVKNWFVDELESRVEIRSVDRTRIESEVSDISSSKVRQALLKGDNKYLKRALTPSVYAMKKDLAEILKRVEENPQDDFIMK